MITDPHRRYESKDDFFALHGSVSMKVTAAAAIDICNHAACHGVFVARVEGGVWHYPGFEARREADTDD